MAACCSNVSVTTHSHAQQEGCCTVDKLTVALVIIGMIGLIAAGAGLGSLGARLGWWSAPTLASIGKLPTYLLLGIGGGVALVSFVIMGVKEARSACATPRLIPISLGSRYAPQSTAASPSTTAMGTSRRATDIVKFLGTQNTMRTIVLLPHIFTSDMLIEPLPTLPKEIGGLTQVTDLDLSQLGLTSLHEGVYNLVRLTKLNIGMNHFSTIPDGISVLTNLTDLRMDFLILYELHDHVCRLPLQTLSLFNNNLTKLPYEFQKLTRLRTLYLGNNPLDDLRYARTLTSLRTLNLAGDSPGPRYPLNTLPQSWTIQLSDPSVLKQARSSSGPTLVEVEEPKGPIYMRAHHIITTRMERHESLDLAQELKRNHAPNNLPLLTVPPEIGKLKALTYLSLNNCNLTILSPEVYKLVELKILKLGDNQFNTIPSGISALTNLEELHMDQLKLEALPTEVCTLSSLRELYLNSNKLTTLPMELGTLSQLSTLHIGNNPFIALPTPLLSLRSLTTLDVRGTTHKPEYLLSAFDMLPKTLKIQLSPSDSDLATRLKAKAQASKGLRGPKIEEA